LLSLEYFRKMLTARSNLAAMGDVQRHSRAPTAVEGERAARHRRDQNIHFADDKRLISRYCVCRS
jgi:hypothetical protein